MRGIVLVDHGSREPAAGAQLERVAERLRARLPDARVEVAHMEIAPPFLAEAVDACVAAGAREVVVAPWFLAPGRHVREDLPRLAREAAARHPGVRVCVADPLGEHPALIDAVLERISECADRSRSG